MEFKIRLTATRADREAFHPPDGPFAPLGAAKGGCSAETRRAAPPKTGHRGLLVTLEGGSEHKGWGRWSTRVGGELGQVGPGVPREANTFRPVTT